MKRLIPLFLFLFAAVFAAAPVRAAWYWPFGEDEEDKNPPRLHRLLEPANNLIEDAEDAALAGDPDKALDLYRKALEELARVARENPDRAETPEFAPLRNKIAATQSAIDAIRFAQVRNGAKAVAVTDTTALEAKLKAEREGKKTGEAKTADEDAKKDEKKNAAKAETEKDEAKKDEAKPEVSEAKKDEAKKDEAEADEAKKAASKAKKDEAKADAAKKDDPKKEKTAEKNDGILDYNGKIRLALKEIREKDYVSADILLEDLVNERPNDLNALVLWAAAQTGLGSYYAARRALEKAHRAHPKSHVPCYNLAYLMFKIPGDNTEDARQYYELGRGLGGPRDKRLEEKFK